MDDAMRQRLQTQLEKAQQNLFLVQERIDDFVEPTSIPLDLRKNEAHWKNRIAELKEQMAQIPEPSVSVVPVEHVTPASPSSVEPDYPIFGVPFRRNPNFTGRDDILSVIDQNLSAETTAISMQVLTGLGGVGKTQIALEFAYRHADEYDVLWWVRTEDEATLTADYDELASELNLSAKAGFEQTLLINLIRHWLERTSKRWLLIFDNAQHPDQIRGLLPNKGNGNVLITSRTPQWQSLGDVLSINPFSLEDARRFLFTYTQERNEVAANRVAELLGCLPLALAQAGAFINDRTMPLETYSELYEAQQQEIWKRSTPPQDYTATVATTWELAFQQLKQSAPESIALLNLCAFLAPDDIPLSILQDGVACLPAALAKVVKSPLELEDIIAALYQYSLIARNEKGLSVHRLVQDVTRNRLDTKETEIWVEVAINLMNIVFPFNRYDISTWIVSARLLSHALTVCRHPAARQVSPLPMTALWQQTGEYLRQQGEYEKAQEVIEQALELRKSVLGLNHTLTAESLDYLGELWHEQASYTESLNLHEQAFNIRQTDLGHEHEDTAKSHNNLGVLFQVQGDYELARTHLEEALAIRKQVLGEQHPDTAMSLNNLGALFQDQGEYELARTHYEEALAICKRWLGEQHPDTAGSLNNLGALFQDQGEYELARTHYEEALAIRKQVLGEQHPDTATSLSNLGVLFQTQGEYELARTHYEEALAIRKQVLGEQHPDTATSLSNLGELFRDQGEYELARTHHEEALAIYKQVLGEPHPDTAIGLNNLGAVLYSQGMHLSAKKYLEQALNNYEAVHGESHPRMVPILTNLAGIMIHLKQPVFARRYLMRAASICRDTNERYAECEKIPQMLKSLPGGVPGSNKGKKDRQKKRRR